jgi:hypothetical protein
MGDAPVLWCLASGKKACALMVGKEDLPSLALVDNHGAATA